jgi:hypothetical protein
MHKILLSAVFASGLLMAGLDIGHAQASRTWVSGVGDDANPCSRTAPCKTFGGTISKTAPKGEINVLDPGGFGAVTITKSVSIVADGTLGGLLAASVNGIIINAAATDVVYIRGLDIEGFGTGLSGIRILRAGAVHINNTIIRDFKGAGGNGISIVPSLAPVKVMVSNTRISNNTTGVLVQPSNSQTANVILDRVTIDGHSGNAVETFTPSAVVDLNNCVISGNFRAVLAHTNSVVNTYGNNVFHNNDRTSSALTPVPLN